MTKSELILRIATIYPHLLPRESARIVDTIFDEIAAALAKRCRVELRGFGAFWIKHRPAHTGCNPSTRATVEVPHRVALAFRTGKGLRERLNRE
jgi:integration host factor subunit beta